MVKKNIKTADLNEKLGTLLKLQDNNVLAFEISRTLKSLKAFVIDYEDKRDTVCNDYLLRDEKGDFITLPDVKTKLESLKVENPNAAPTIFGYELQPGKSREEFKKLINDLLDIEVEINILPVDAKAKLVSSKGINKPLIKALEEDNLFLTSEILILEELGILYNLD